MLKISSLANFLFVYTHACVCAVHETERTPASEKLSVCMAPGPGSGAPHLCETDVCRDPVSDRERHDVSRHQVSSKKMLELSFSYAVFEMGKSKSTHVDISFLGTLINEQRSQKHTFSFPYGQTLVPLRFYYFLNSPILKDFWESVCLLGDPEPHLKSGVTTVHSAWKQSWATRPPDASAGLGKRFLNEAGS